MKRQILMKNPLSIKNIQVDGLHDLYSVILFYEIQS